MDNGGGGYSPNLQFAECFNSPTKLCVCIFAFISGWAIALGKLTYRKSVGRIQKLMGSYWCIAIPAILLAVFVWDFELSGLGICKELLGLGASVMIFAWYVPFYAVALIVMVFIQKWLDRDIKTALLVGVVLPMIVFTLMKKIPTSIEIQTLFNNLRHWFPCISVGYICNKNNCFDKIRSALGNYNRFLISGILIIFCFAGRYFISALDFCYCALLVFAIVNLQIHAKSCIGKFLYQCGKNSANMWFLHCLYFGEATRNLIQPLAYWAKSPILIYAVAVIELLCCSGVISWIKNRFGRGLGITN